MIKKSTIDAVHAALNTYDIVSQFVDLKKAGSGYKAKSPFTEEKTPSFHVVTSKNIYKDFSSGKGGNGINFLMEFKGFTYPQAIEFVAEHYGIEVEYEKQTDKQKEAYTSRSEIKSLLLASNKRFTTIASELADDHPAKSQLLRFSESSINEFQIGYTGDDSRYLYKVISEKAGLEQAEKAGLVRNHQGNYYDFFQKRVVFPICNEYGEIIGFGGRAIDDQNPKYLNSPKTATFDKSKVLYGYDQAQIAIKKEQMVYITEGYADVIAMHEMQLHNTVGTLGTALSIDQIQMIKRTARGIVILRDGDEAGQKAAIRDMELIISNGLEAKFIPLPEKTDPYDLLHSDEINDPVLWLLDHTHDALEYFSIELKNKANTPTLLADATQQIAQWISLIPNNVTRNAYRKMIANSCKLKLKDLKDCETTLTQVKQKKVGYEVNSQLDLEDKLPEGITVQDVYRDGFYPLVDGLQTGYYFMTGAGSFSNCSNFVMTPLFHKYEEEDNTRVFRLENGVTKAEIVEMPSAALISKDSFRKFLFDKGPYYFYGTAQHLDKLNQKYLYEFPKAFELKTLGWQKEGFFAFFDRVHNGALVEYDDAGLVKHDDQFYFSPAASSIYSGIRKDNDHFENDRYLSYVKAEIDFEEWMDLMEKVYGEHAYAGILFVCIALFRDIVFKVDNNCPHLYCFGQSKAGKSKYAESIMNMFFREMSAFNLNGGTDFAFANRLQRFKNVPVSLNEFDDKVCKDEWFQMIKGAYDGEGRERGKGGSKNKTETQKVNAALILIGQYLSTKDDNSVLSRSIICSFSLTNDRSDDQVHFYNRLKEIEKKGLSSLIIEILQHREYVAKEYYTSFNEQFKFLQSIIRSRGKQYDERVLRNYTALFTMYELFKKHFNFPWTKEDYQEWVVKEVIKLSAMITESDILNDFWTHVNGLNNKKQLSDRHFRLDTPARVNLTNKSTYECDYEEKILFIKLNEVQLLYAESKKRTGESPLAKSSLTSYLENRDYYIGQTKYKLGSKSTHCHVIKYDMIPELDLEHAESLSYQQSNYN
ncbi:MAG: DNA primase [Cyclobacteriaceae bacterium]